MSEETFHTTSEDLRRMEHDESKLHPHGEIPAGSEAAMMQSKIAKATDQKSEKIDRVKGNLPLPDDPPAASDWGSADVRTVNVGSGGVSGDVSNSDKGASSAGLREPATAESSVRVSGEKWKKNTAP